MSRAIEGRALRVVDIINLSSSADTLLRERVLSLRERGHDNHIVCADGPCVRPLREAGIPVATVPIPRGLNPFLLAWSLVRIWAYLRRVKPDIVHTHCSVPGIVGRLAARLAGVPVVLHTVHGFAFHDGSRGFTPALAIAVERLAGRLTDLLLSQNREDMARAIGHRIMAPERLRWIGNGIALERFPDVPPRPEGDRPVIITCVARLEPVKNHLLLLEAARLLKDRDQRFELWLVGDGQARARYRSTCAAWGLGSHVRFLGYRDDIPALLAQSDIATLTSLKEGIPRAVLEGMAAGLPVVATDVTGTREVVRDGDTGFLVSPHDANGLAAALERLIGDPALREQMGSRGREVVRAGFDEAEIVRNLERVYRDAIERFASGARSVTPARGEVTRVGRNTAFRSAAQAASAIVNVAGMVLLGNHLSLAGYGEYVALVALIPLVASVADMGAGVIVTREMARGVDAARLLGDGIMLRAIVGAGLLLAAALAGPALSPGAPWLVLLIAAAAVLDFGVDAAVWAFRARERLDFEALLLLASQLVWLAGVALGVRLGGSLGWFLGAAAAAFALRTLVGLVLLARLRLVPRLSFVPGRLRALAADGWPVALSLLLVVLYGRAGVFALRILGSAADVARFNVAYMLSQPLGFLASALAMAAFPAIARRRDGEVGSLARPLQATRKAQLLVALPIAAGLLLVADRVVPLLFHDRAGYGGAVAALRVMALALPCVFLNLHARYLLAALGRQRAYLHAVLLGLAVNTIGCALTARAMGALGAAWTFVAAESLVCMACARALSAGADESVRPGLARPLVSTALMAVVVIAVRGAGLWVQVATGVLAYGAALVATRALSREEWAAIRGVVASFAASATPRLGPAEAGMNGKGAA